MSLPMNRGGANQRFDHLGRRFAALCHEHGQQTPTLNGEGKSHLLLVKPPIFRAPTLPSTNWRSGIARDVLPCLAPANMADRDVIDPISLANGYARLRRGQNGAHVIIGKFRMWCNALRSGIWSGVDVANQRLVGEARGAMGKDRTLVLAVRLVSRNGMPTVIDALIEILSVAIEASLFRTRKTIGGDVTFYDQPGKSRSAFAPPRFLKWLVGMFLLDKIAVMNVPTVIDIERRPNIDRAIVLITNDIDTGDQEIKFSGARGRLSGHDLTSLQVGECHASGCHKHRAGSIVPILPAIAPKIHRSAVAL